MTAESAADFFSELGSRSNNNPSGAQGKNNNAEDQKIEEEPQREAKL